MSKTPEMFTCKICGETKPLEGFYTNSKIDKSKPYELVCRICYQARRKARERGAPLNIKPTNARRGKSIKLVTHAPAMLTCSIEDFHEFLGDNIKNRIPALTKSERGKLNLICPKCERKVRQIDSAHVHGRDIRKVTEDVIKNYITDNENQIIQVDLNKVIDEILEAHKPFKDHFRFLCPKCHKKYDHNEFCLGCCEGKTT